MTKKTQETHWLIEWKNSQDKNSNRLSITSHFKKYTVATSRKIVLKQPMRDIQKKRVSYDLLEQSKIVNLAQPGEQSWPI